MNTKSYNSERGLQIVISLLKAHNIRKVIASPGATNITFVGSLQNDPWFEIYSCVDERSAAYMACGMAAESGEPVVLSCTGATSSRNYMPGLTEAYYRKLPILAVTSTQGNHRLGNLAPQNIDRRVLPNDIAKVSVYVPFIHDKVAETEAELNVNKAILELTRHGGGPAHINLETRYSSDFSIQALPVTRVIHRIMPTDEFPILSGKVAVFVGSHAPFTPQQEAILDKFCAVNNAIVVCDHTSGYKGKYRALLSLVNTQTENISDLSNCDVLVHIGEVSGDYEGSRMRPKEVWRVNEDGELRDWFGKLTTVFEMREQDFFTHYAQGEEKENTYFQAFTEEYLKISQDIPELPFSNLWIAQQVTPRLPKNAVLHLGILNSLRSWNNFEIPNSVTSFCNVGAFGIDGCVSSMVGAALASPDKIFIGVVGDLAFFYDMNIIGNRHLPNNFRLLVINNGIGIEFKNYSHQCAIFGNEANQYMAAGGHFGCKSPTLLKHFAEDLGLKYYTASNKEEFNIILNDIVNPEQTNQPLLCELFTNEKDESDALYLIKHLVIDHSLNAIAKRTANKLLDDKTKSVLRKIIR